jgi:hypothetical protein
VKNVGTSLLGFFPPISHQTFVQADFHPRSLTENTSLRISAQDSLTVIQGNA